VATRLILIRHGHTANNSGGDARLIGRTDVALSDRGEDELRRLCERLRGARPFDAIYSSPLQRAWRIAMALEELGLGSVRRCDGLVEIDCGTLDGRRVEEVKREHPELWEANVRQRDEHFRWPGGESYREFRCRALRAARAVAHAHPGKRVALVTHAGVISQLLGSIGRVNPARWEYRRPENTAITTIVWGRQGRRVVRFDDHSHLHDDDPPA